MLKKPIWTTPILLEEVNKRGKNTLSDHLGIEFIAVGDDFLSATMPIDSRTLQPMGILHGGASCALAETVGSTAGNCCVDQKKSVCVGLEININHIRAVKAGMVTGTARPLHLGKNTQVWEIKIVDEKERLISAARLTLVVLKRSS